MFEIAVEEPREKTTPTKSEIPLNAADWEPGQITFYFDGKKFRYIPMGGEMQ